MAGTITAFKEVSGAIIGRVGIAIVRRRDTRAIRALDRVGKRACDGSRAIGEVLLTRAISTSVLVGATGSRNDIAVINSGLARLAVGTQQRCFRWACYHTGAQHRVRAAAAIRTADVTFVTSSNDRAVGNGSSTLAVLT